MIRLFLGSPRFSRLPLLAALAVSLWLASPVTAAHAARRGNASPRAALVALDDSLGATLEGGRLAEARAFADSAIALRRQRLGQRGAPLASSIDSLALRFFAVGTHEGWELAVRYFEQSLALKEGALGPDDLEVAKTSSALGVMNEYLGRWDEASKRSRRALDIRLHARGPRDPLVASSLRQLGMDRFELGDYAEAESLLTRSLATWEGLEGDHAERVTDALNNLGEIARVQDRFDRAEASFLRGLAVARARLPADAPLRAALMNNLAGLFKDLARYDDAEPLLLESLRLFEAASEPDSMTIATAHLNLAEVQRLQGRLEEAEPHYAHALVIARSILGAGHPELAPFVNQAAALYQELGDLDRAEALLRGSLAAAEASLGRDHPAVAQGYDDLGRLLTAKGSYAAAEEALARARTIRESRLGANHPDVAVTRVHLAENDSHRERGDPSALADLQRAIPVLDASGTYPEARLEAYALRSSLRERAGDATAALADLSIALSAIDSLRARRGGGEFSRAALLGKHLGLYHQSARLHLAAGDPDGALEAHERGRARILLEQIASSRLDLRAGIPAAELAPLLDQETNARQRLAREQRLLQAEGGDAGLDARRLERVAALEASRDSAAWDVQRALEQMRERSPLWRRMLTTNGRPATRAEITAALGRDEALLEYHVGPDASYAFLLERGGPARAVPLVIGASEAERLGVAPGPLDAARLERIVAGDPGVPGSQRLAIAAMLGDPATAANERVRVRLDERLAALMRVLVPEPIAARLRSVSHAVVVPDGALHLLPFEALVTRLGGDATSYWIDDGPALRYAASATSLVELERRSQEAAGGQPLSVLSVCDPAFGATAALAGPDSTRGATRGANAGIDPTHGANAGENALDPAVDAADPTLRGGWAPLPGTRRETAAIRAAFAPLPVDTLVGAAATEPAVRAALPRYRLLHLATHGFVTERRGDVLGGLVLAPGAPGSESTDDDGLLQLFEIYRMELDADLVVLSACETARGPRVAGEGVFALSRGFLAAGARRAIASLWPVNDVSTAELMSALFERLARAERSGKTVDTPALVREAKLALRSRPEYRAPFHWAPFVLSGVR